MLRALSIGIRNGTSLVGALYGVEVLMSTYAGVDWASEKHDVLIADETGEEILAATFAHDEAGVRGLCRALVRHEVTLVAIERPD